MSKEYTGMESINNFFEHYGRKGMKRGMNIFNPNYKPIGEKAAASAKANAYAKQQRDRQMINSNPSSASQISSANKYASQMKDAASRKKIYSKYTGGKESLKKSAEDNRREALLNAERKRYEKKSAEEKSNAKQKAFFEDYERKKTNMIREHNEAVSKMKENSGSKGETRETKDTKAIKAIKLIESSLGNVLPAYKMLYQKVDINDEELSNLAEGYAGLLHAMFDMQYGQYHAMSVDDWESAKRAVDLLKNKKDKDSVATLEALYSSKALLTKEIVDAKPKDTSDVAKILSKYNASNDDLSKYAKLVDEAVKAINKRNGNA